MLEVLKRGGMVIAQNRSSAHKNCNAVIAQVVEHRLGKTKVISANLINGSNKKTT